LISATNKKLTKRRRAAALQGLVAIQAGSFRATTHFGPWTLNFGLNIMNKINLSDKLSLIKDHWNPRIVGELNGQYMKLVKFVGPFTWHHHDTEDEMFLVVKGRFCMEFREEGRDDRVWLEEGEFMIVPRGVEHRPVAEEEAHVLLFEPASTLNTGNVPNELPRPRLDWI
jgi:mannose-6-phosphate isomerase-like protein (cupin superfamily)